MTLQYVFVFKHQWIKTEKRNGSNLTLVQLFVINVMQHSATKYQFHLKLLTG